MLDRNIFPIPLNDVFVDYDWNVRSREDTFSNISDAVQDSTGDKTSQGEGLQSLMQSMHILGQDNPVIVRKIENKKSMGGLPTERPVELVAGFRRYTAAWNLNTIARNSKEEYQAIANIENEHILAREFVGPPILARLQNGRENTERNNLKTPDLVWAIRDLEKQGMTQETMADGLGISKGYTWQLAQIASLNEVILRHWREGKRESMLIPEGGIRQLTTQEMLKIAKLRLNDDEALKAYVQILKGPTPIEAGKIRKKISVETRIKRIACLLKNLTDAGFVIEGHMVWGEVIGDKKKGYPINVGNLDREQLIKLYRVAEEGYKNGKNGKES